MKLVKILIWPIISYGAEGWTLRAKEEKHLNAAEVLLWRRLLRVSYEEHRTNASIFEEVKSMHPPC